jgi:endonuclease III
MPAARPRAKKRPGAPASTAGEHRDLPFALPQVAPGEKKRAARLARLLEEHYPSAKCALEYRNPHELLIATILSAQTTDVGVNKSTPALFARFPTPADYAAASPQDIEPFVRSLGFFRNKAKAIHLAMKDIVQKFGSRVPRTMDELLSLHGVARKTANVVLGNAYGVNAGFVVDTHIERLARRYCLAGPNDTVQTIERRLMALFPRDTWCALSHMFIWHGRAACSARGKGCSDHAICREFGDCCDRRPDQERTNAKRAKRP